MGSAEDEIRSRLEAGDSIDSVIEHIRSLLTEKEWADYEIYLVGVGPVAEVALESDATPDPEQTGPLWSASANAEDVLIEGLPQRLRDGGRASK